VSQRIYKKYQPEVLPSMTGLTELPTDRPIAIYYRQSTDGQVGNVSTFIQTVDMVEYLKLRGWTKNQIIMVDTDKGISGTTKIDERPGMSYLYEMITEEKIGAVACQDEDRLFRDVTQIQVNIFIEACKKANVLVLTPSMVYDFSNPMTGMWHARQFRFKSEMAAEYINTVIKGRMHAAKKRINLEGKWVTGFIPVGYMIDMRKTLPGGNENDNYRKYAIFEPYAEVIREYFRLFLSYSGNVRRTHLHIRQYGPYYPNPKDTLPPEGFKVDYKLKSYDGKFHPSRAGLKAILTNARFIGHWLNGDSVVKRNNHPAIIDEDAFFQAFNFLSPTSLEGHRNESYRRIQLHARPSREDARPHSHPLCAGLMVTLERDKWYRVGTKWQSTRQHYIYVYWPRDDTNQGVWKRKAQGIDEAIERLVWKKLKSTFSPNKWNNAMAAYEENFGRSRRLQHQRLKQIKREMQNLVGSLSALTNSQMILAAQRKYEEMQEEHSRLELLLAKDDLEATQVEKLHTYRKTCGPVLENWECLTDEEKRATITAFVSRIEATPTEGQGIQLNVRWRDSSCDELRIRRQSSTGMFWTPAEVERLHSLVVSGAKQVEIASTFPNRKWESIRQRYRRDMGKGKSLKIHPKPIRDKETYHDYYLRTQSNALERVGFEDGYRSSRLVFHR